MDRRQYLVTAATAGTALFAGCQGDGDDDATDTPEETVGLTFAHPQTVDVDEPFDLTVEGLPTDTTVDIVLESDFAANETATATATIETDDGDVPLQRATVVDGDVPPSLDVPLPVALVQFLEGRPGDLAAPPEIDRETLTYRVERESETLGSTSLSREFPSEDWLRPIEHDDLVGQVATPADGASGPPVLVLHGSGGQPFTRHALAFASNGYTALALQYFGDHETLPDDLVEIPLEYVERAIQWLLDHDRVEGDRVGLFGVSKGGELALLTGSEYSSVGAVVSHVGSGVVWQGVTADSGIADGSSWSKDGEPVPYVPARLDADWERDSPRGYVDSLEAASEEERSAATIPVENIDGDVLLVSGGNDNLWNTLDLHAIAEQRLGDHDHPAYNHLVYEEAGHSIPLPYLPVEGTATRPMGGTEAGNAVASHEHWPNVLDTFEIIR